MDSSKNKIASCSYESSIQDSKLENEKLQENIPANSSISGYVYCKTDSTAGAMINVIMQMALVVIVLNLMNTILRLIRIIMKSSNSLLDSDC